MLDPHGGTVQLEAAEFKLISKAEAKIKAAPDKDAWAAKRAAEDAKREEELQKQWEGTGRTGRVPRVGLNRTSPIHPQWWGLPWFDAWVAAGCDHQTLGITSTGIRQLCLVDLAYLKMNEWGDNTIEEWGHGYDRCACSGLEWITSAFGPGPTGYDLGALVRKYDAAVGHEDKSMLEILLTRGPTYSIQQMVVHSSPLMSGEADARPWGAAVEWMSDRRRTAVTKREGDEYVEVVHEAPCGLTYFEPPSAVERVAYVVDSSLGQNDTWSKFEWTKHVGPADVFYSHVQLKPVCRTLKCIEKGIETYDAELKAFYQKKEGGDTAREAGPRFWLDYFNLRQCQNDFSPPAVVDLVGTIGFVFIEFDFDPLAYLNRTFCALEAFASVKHGVGLGIILDEAHALGMTELLNKQPIKVANAQARRKKDKDKIDGYIKDSVGFDAVDLALTQAAMDGALKIKGAVFDAVHLDFLGCRLTPDTVPAIVEIVKNAKGLKTIGLIGNAFGEEGALAVAAACNEQRVTMLPALWRRYVEQKGSEPNLKIPCWAFEGLGGTNSPLNELFHLDQSREADVSDAVLVMQHAKKYGDYNLNFPPNFGDACAEYIAKVLATTDMFYQISFEQTRVGLKGLQALAAALPTNKRLASITLFKRGPDDFFGEPEQKDIFEYLEDSPELQAVKKAFDEHKWARVEGNGRNSDAIDTILERRRNKQEKAAGA